MTKPRAGLAGLASGLVFVAAQAVSLLANYGFQLLAARRLAPAEYVALFGWLAELAAYGVLSILALNVALTRPPSRRARRSLVLGGGLIAIAATLGAIMAPSGTPVPIGLVVLVAVAFGFASGEALARQALATAALASTAIFVVRIGWFVAVPRLDVGERGTLLGFAVGIAVLLAAVARRGEAALGPAPDDGAFGAHLLRALLLSGAQAVAPVADYLLVRSAVPDALQAAWASGSLLFRVPVVLGMGVLQVTFAKRLAAARGGPAPPRWVPVIEVAMPASLALLALVPTGELFPALMQAVLGGARADYAALPFGRMLWSAGALLAALTVLQLAHAAKALRASAIALAAALVVALLLAAAGGMAWETKVLALAMLWTSFAGVLLWRLPHERSDAPSARVRARSDAERGQDAGSGAVGGAPADSRTE